MIPRSHTPKPTSHDRGPPSKEDTQTDFAALNVLGNIPAPTTAIDACLDTGFHLNSGVKVTGGDGVLLVGGEAFAWSPWKVNAGMKSDMLNKKGQFEVDEQAWGLLGLVWPRPGESATFPRYCFKGVRVDCWITSCDRLASYWYGGFGVSSIS